VLAGPDPILATAKRGLWSDFRWHDQEGEAKRGALMMPTNGQSASLPPVVIVPYDFAENPGGALDAYFLPDGQHPGADAAAQILAANGFAVLWIDAWDSKGSGSPTEGPEFVKRVDDVLDALRRQGRVDVTRAGLMGFSRGGYMTLYHATHPGKNPIAAYIGLDNYLGSLAAEMGFSMEDTSGFNVTFGNFFGNREQWLKADTLTHADASRAPILMTLNGYLGKNANSPWLDQMSIMPTFGSFRMANRPFDHLTFPDGDHELRRPRERIVLLNAINDWMSFWLKGVMPIDSNLARRWSRLRSMAASAPSAPN
jgi:dienelactone hydrolase